MSVSAMHISFFSTQQSEAVMVCCSDLFIDQYRL